MRDITVTRSRARQIARDLWAAKSDSGVATDRMRRYLAAGIPWASMANFARPTWDRADELARLYARIKIG